LKIYPGLISIPPEILGKNDESFVWTTPYETYLEISKELTSSLVDIIYNGNLSSNLKLASVSILSVMNIDLIRIARAIIDSHYASLNNIEIIYEQDDCPVAYFIVNGNVNNLKYLARIESFYPGGNEKKSIKQRIFGVARRSVSEIESRLKKTSGRYDLQNECLLLRQYMTEMDVRPVNMRTELWPWKSKNNSYDEAQELVLLIIDSFKNILHKFDASLNIIKKSEYVAKIFLTERLRQALDKACFIENIELDNIAGDVLVGGTPQQDGRLLNWKYQIMGRKVWRFAHGGDRAFYDDSQWGLSELPYCGVYHVHGKGEAQAFKSKLARRRTYFVPEFKPDVISIGSLKHQLIWGESKLNKGRKYKSRSKLNIVFVAGSFLGEKHMGCLDFKMPDSLIADTQSWVINTLKEMKYNVSIKIHPGGFYHNLKIQERWGISVLSGRFNNENIDANVYIFDFAGTAFFDALASEKGIVQLIFCGSQIVDVKANRITECCKQQLNEYFEGQRKTFDVPLDPHGTNFQKSVWACLLKIPFGETKTISSQHH